MFTCFDILFGSPGVYLVRGIGVTDMAFPTAWMNELPLLTAIEFQEAWSMQFAVPLLASNTHLPLNKMTGSGIYNGRQGHIVYHYDMVTYHGKLLIGEIHRPTGIQDETLQLRQDIVQNIIKKLKQMSPSQLKDVSPHILAVLNYDTKMIPTSAPVTSNNQHSAKLPWLGNHSIDVVPHSQPPRTFQALMNDDLYTFVPLLNGIGGAHVSSSKISCALNYSRETGSKDHFALGAFDGWHTVDGRYRIQACALVRCPDGDWSKCGQATSYSRTVFKWFSLQMYGMDQNAIFFPEVLTSGINLAKIGIEWKNDCPACSWVYSDKGVKRPLLTASLFARIW